KSGQKRKGQDFGETMDVEMGCKRGLPGYGELKCCQFLTKSLSSSKGREITGEEVMVPVETLATARAYFQRFYMRKSFRNKDYHQYMVGATCLFLACKTTDKYQHLNNLIPKCRLVASKWDKSMPKPNFKETDK
ncbi:hypothetical protein HDU76_010432, partial [Blyttiomyces sp. JEL0837]